MDEVLWDDLMKRARRVAVSRKTRVYVNGRRYVAPGLPPRWMYNVTCQNQKCPICNWRERGVEK